MITNNNQRLMVWTVVVLLLLNVTTIATIGFHIWKSNREASFEMGKRQINAEPIQFNGRFIRDKLNLSNDQMEQFREINPKFRDEVRNKKQQLSDFRTQMLDEMMSEKPDTAKLNVISANIGETHKQLKISTYNYYFDLKKICNTTQKVLLDSIFAENMLADVPGRMGRFGKGCGPQNGQGFGPGKGFGNGQGPGNGNGRRAGRCQR